MPEFFLELFSEEIPARMQKDAATSLVSFVMEALFPLSPVAPNKFYGPRRIALRLDVESTVPASVLAERGPRLSAPDAALAGFLRKHGAEKDDLSQEGEFWVLNKKLPEISARQLILDTLPQALKRLPWPKSMRWGQSGDFTWVRPLRRIICLLGGEIVPITLGPITASNETEGHRVHSSGSFAVSSMSDWRDELLKRNVIADELDRSLTIQTRLSGAARSLGLRLAEDDGLLQEVTGLVEWPVPLIGKIDAKFMDLPPEVRELSMKVNQKYFALRDQSGRPAPYFAFVANLEAPDGGAAIIAGNERVLRARLSDARHFWDQDLNTPLDSLLPKLEKITFHAKIGTQRQRADRIAALARRIASILGASNAEAEQAAWAGLLCKADLVTGMVGEFPELQGIMGGYYAEKNPTGWNGALVGPAIKTHYQPKGPGDAVPTGTIPVSVALADKLDTLTEFFKAGEKPTGSGDPYALRRAALGIIRIIRENQLSLHLRPLINNDDALFDFIIERLRVKLRGEGERFDILDAVLSAAADDDLLRIMQRVEAVRDFLKTPDGANLLTAYRRGANILKIENAKDGPHKGEDFISDLSQQDEERNLGYAIGALRQEFFGYSDQPPGGQLEFRHFKRILENFASLRAPVDAFFDKVTVNAPVPEIRLNRLRLLAQLRHTMDTIADFSKIEG